MWPRVDEVEEDGNVGEASQIQALFQAHLQSHGAFEHPRWGTLNEEVSSGATHFPSDH